jgi:heterodisulfide reductase subunit B
MKYLYYPGCSQKATSKGYEESLLAICPELGIELTELDDWSCCGTTTVVSVNRVLALTLAARNLALAEKQGGTLLTPCPSCLLSLTKANRVLAEGGELADKVQEALAAGGYEYAGTVEVRHLLEVLIDAVGPEAISDKVSSPLEGLTMAPYYGCQILRPYAPGDDQDEPKNLETLITAAGAEPIAFEHRASCCGGTLVATRPKVGQKMSAEILEDVHRAGCDMVVTPCSLCQVTLEMVQRKTRKLLGHKMKLPIVNVSQLLGLAMGRDLKELGLNRALVPKKCVRALKEKTSSA